MGKAIICHKEIVLSIYEWPFYTGFIVPTYDNFKRKIRSYVLLVNESTHYMIRLIKCQDILC